MELMMTARMMAVGATTRNTFKLGCMRRGEIAAGVLSLVFVSWHPLSRSFCRRTVAFTAPRQTTLISESARPVAPVDALVRLHVTEQGRANKHGDQGGNDIRR